MPLSGIGGEQSTSGRLAHRRRCESCSVSWPWPGGELSGSSHVELLSEPCHIPNVCLPCTRPCLSRREGRIPGSFDRRPGAHLGFIWASRQAGLKGPLRSVSAIRKSLHTLACAGEPGHTIGLIAGRRNSAAAQVLTSRPAIIGCDDRTKAAASTQGAVWLRDQFPRPERPL